MKHANAREVRWSESRVRKLAEEYEPELRRELLQYVGPNDLERTVNLFLDLRLTDFLYELQTGIGLWTREQTIAVAVNVIRGYAPPPPPLKITPAGASALAQAILGRTCTGSAH